MQKKYKYANYSFVKKCLKKHKRTSHKGENGCVLVIGGCEDYVSAPALSASSALKTGIDLIVVAAPKLTAYAINSFFIDFITKKFEGNFFAKKHGKELTDFSKDFDVVLIGPGLGKRKETKEFVNDFVKKCELPLVIDADALQQLDRKNIKENSLITPHKKEFEILFGKKIPKSIDERIDLVKEMAVKHKCVILLKGVVDIISDGNEVVLNKTGNEGMTVGGTGDLLSGMCSGLLALSENPLKSACAAAYLNGTIGDHLLKKLGYGFVASDFIELVPKAVYNKKF